MSSKSRLKILFLSRWLPYPPNNGSKLRIYHLLRGLTQVHDITLITFAEEADIEVAPELKDICEKVHLIPYRPYNPASLRSIGGLFTLTPRSVIDTHVPEMERCIRTCLSEGDYDLIIASQRDMAAYWQAFGETPTLFEELEFGFFDNQRTAASTQLQRLRHKLTFLKMQAYVRRIAPKAKLCTVVSRQEAALLKEMAPAGLPIEVVPNGVSLAAYADIQEEPRPNTLIFTGSFRYGPNHQAMVWFLEKVYPLVQTEVPDVHLTITGDHADLPLPAAQNVTQSGFVDDIGPLVASSWCSIVPIFQGGGTRLKILEAMAMGVPVVASSKGAEGLEIEAGKEALIADQPDAFAKAVIQLLQSPKLRQELSNNGYELIRSRYDWSVIMPQFLALIEQVAYA